MPVEYPEVVGTVGSKAHAQAIITSMPPINLGILTRRLSVFCQAINCSYDFKNRF